MLPSRGQRLAAGLAALLVGGAAGAQPLRLPRLLADGAVLQRGAPIPVWGWAAPNATVTVTFRGATRTARADSAGRWSVRLAAAPAGGPYTLTAAAGTERVVLHDVLVGDVWLASGQSNMEWPVARVTNAPTEIAAAHDSLLRQFKVPISYADRPEDDVTGGDWQPADPQHVGGFSGVAYFFARDLRAAEHVPIGIVNSTWGGSAIETWLAAEAQGLPPDGGARALVAERERLATLGATVRARIGPVPERDPGLVDGRAVWADPALDDTAWKTVTVPAPFEEQGFADVDGVVWYRTGFTLTAAEAAQPVTLALGPVDDDDVTWINGVQVGRTGGAGAPRTYAVPAAALRAGRNVLAVRVTDYGGGGGIFGGPAPSLTVSGTARPLAGPWRLRVGELATQMDGQRVNKVPAITYNRMIHPLLPFPIRGAIWYQGESNANTDAQALAYRAQFRTLITSWRAAWQGSARTFPFLWVQLPNYGRPDSVPTPSGGGWALQRASMAAALALPNTGQAIAIDVGGATELHPTNKQDPGHRLALVARRVAYGERVVASGPTYRTHVVRGGRVLVTFDHADGGLRSTASDGSVGAFALAGADRRWAWAQARVEGDHVVVWSDRVPDPVAVRYAWSNSPVHATLQNGARLPAAPFRTDSW